MIPLPDRYLASVAIADLQNAFALATDDLHENVAELRAQLNVATATWGLDAWEAALGLPTDVSQSYAARRERVLSKLRGSGTTTPSMIETVAESFSNGAVTVIEDNPNYTFTIRFTGTIGEPPNLDGLKAAIEEIKPAHLAVLYEIIYRTWALAGARTWGSLAAVSWDDLRGGDID